MPTDGGGKPSVADAMIGIGAALAVVSLGALAGFWWAVLVLGLGLVGAGVVRSRAE